MNSIHSRLQDQGGISSFDYEFDLFSPLASLNKLVAACSDIRVNKEMSSIEVNTGHWRTILKKLKTEIAKASDCVNGTWLEDLGVTDYNTITKKYFQHRSWQNWNNFKWIVFKSFASCIELFARLDRDRWVRRSKDEEINMIPWEEHIIIYNFVCEKFSHNSHQ